METVISRKRSLSPDQKEQFSVQNKIYINQKVFNESNLDKMKEIHSKTINLLFKGAKNYEAIKIKNNNDSNVNEMLSKIRLNGNGKVIFVAKEKPQGYPDLKLLSNCCEKKCYIKSDCINCNNILCEYCGSSCINCGKFLCTICISLFDCGSVDEPLCEGCKFFN